MIANVEFYFTCFAIVANIFKGNFSDGLSAVYLDITKKLVEFVFTFSQAGNFSSDVLIIGDCNTEAVVVKKVFVLDVDCLLYTSPSPRDRG